MPRFGAHMSIAGGFHKAVAAAVEHGMETVQLFTTSPQIWTVAAGESPHVIHVGDSCWSFKPVADSAIREFRDAASAARLVQPCAHSSYLINLAAASEPLWQRSVASFIVELQRADALGLAGVVIHPGSAVGLTEDEAIARIVAGLEQCLAQTSGLDVEVWLETTAGQGSSIGHRFEHLAEILSQLSDTRRIGICVDTCHIFAAGYPLQTAEEYAETMRKLDAAVGLDRVRAFHLNDSKKELGSRVDRHEHIGEGKLGLEPFRHLVNDARFADRPMYLETPKGNRDGQTLDAINLATLKSLLASAEPPPRPAKTDRAKKARAK